MDISHVQEYHYLSFLGMNMVLIILGRFGEEKLPEWEIKVTHNHFFPFWKQELLTSLKSRISAAIWKFEHLVICKIYSSWSFAPYTFTPWPKGKKWDFKIFEIDILSHMINTTFNFFRTMSNLIFWKAWQPKMKKAQRYKIL